jgi:hypothetical protein
LIRFSSINNGTHSRGQECWSFRGPQNAWHNLGRELNPKRLSGAIEAKEPLLIKSEIAQIAGLIDEKCRNVIF